MLRFIPAAVLAISSSLPLVALAAPQTLFCTMSDVGANGGWIPPEIALAFDTATGEAAVTDGLILHFHGSPLTAKIASDNAAQTVLTWTLRGQDGSHNSSTMSFRATITKADNSIFLTMRPLNYDNSFRSRGTCEPV
jgi:hypothetical protein